MYVLDIQIGERGPSAERLVAGKEVLCVRCGTVVEVCRVVRDVVTLVPAKQESERLPGVHGYGDLQETVRRQWDTPRAVRHAGGAYGSEPEAPGIVPGSIVHDDV